MYVLRRKQVLPISIEEAWAFLSDPNNLSVITPDDMGFDIQRGGSEQMYAGQLIEYTVKPLLGIPVKWVTEITHVDNPHFFVDEQRFGPYKFWHHKHILKSADHGVEIEDVVHYKLPFGPLGKMIHPIIVAPRLRQIFDYRREKLHKLFGEIDTHKIAV